MTSSTFYKIARMGVLVLTIGLALPLAACSGAAGINFRNTKPQLVAEPDSTSLMIADAADRATRALESLAAVEQTRTPGVAAAAAMVPNAPVELQRAVTFQWSGPVEDVTRDMAARAGYSFSTVGDLPPTPIIVNLNAYNEPLIEVFRDIGLQMGTRADLKLDASRHTVDILYTPTVNRVMPNSSSTSEVTLHRKRPSR